MKLCLNILKPQPLAMTLLTAGVAFFSFSQSGHAGFEWIPPTQTAAPQIEKVQPAPGSALAPAGEPAMEMDDAFLPIPGEEPAPLADGDMNAAPAAMQPVEAAPMMDNTQDGPMPITSRPQQMKTLHMGAEPAPQQETMVTPMPMDEPAAEPMPLEQPPQKAVMPADTPEDVKAAVASSSGMGLKVDPYPVSNAPVATPTTVREPFQQTPLEDKDVVGFGTDIPLALALQQVAPAGYAFSFGETINPGAKVSWSGGDNWVNVMQRMIEPLGLQANIRGRVIFVSNQRDAAAPTIQIESETPAATPQQVAAIEAPADIEPAAGAEDLDRVAINDPGQTGQQPQKTIKVLSERQPLAKIEPASGDTNIVWEAKKGDSLKETLEGWSKSGDFDVDWTAMHDYTLESDVAVAGEFNAALKSLIKDALSNDDAPSFIIEHSGDDKKPTLIVKEPV